MIWHSNFSHPGKFGPAVPGPAPSLLPEPRHSRGPPCISRALQGSGVPSSRRGPLSPHTGSFVSSTRIRFLRSAPLRGPGVVRVPSASNFLCGPCNCFPWNFSWIPGFFTSPRDLYNWPPESCRRVRWAAVLWSPLLPAECFGGPQDPLTTGAPYPQIQGLCWIGVTPRGVIGSHGFPAVAAAALGPGGPDPGR